LVTATPASFFVCASTSSIGSAFYSPFYNLAGVIVSLTYLISSALTWSFACYCCCCCFFC